MIGPEQRRARLDFVRAHETKSLEELLAAGWTTDPRHKNHVVFENPAEFGDKPAMIYFCNDCRCTLPHIFMLWQPVWDSIAAPDTGPNKRLLLCLACADKRARTRLGRPLTIEDFNRAPCNGPFKLGWQLAKEQL